MGSESLDSINCGSKIFAKNPINFQRAKLELAA